MLKLWKKNLSSREVFELALNKTVKEISDDFAKFFDEFFKNIKVPPPPPQDPANRQLLEQEDQLPKMNLTPQQLDFLASYAAAFLNSDKKRAQKLAKIVLLKNENHPLANFVMGWVYKYLNLDNNSAKQKFLTAINNGLDTSGVYRELGKILFEESNYVEAEGYLLKAIEKMPYYLQPYIDENPYLMLGKMYEETNQYEKAKEIYDKYLQLGAKDFDVIVKIADAFFEKNDFVNALDYYKLAAYIKLDNPLLHFNIARTYIKLKEYDNALSVLDILEKFTLLEIERTKNKKEKAAKKEAVAKIYCTKAKIYKTKGAQTEAENLATKADKVDKDIKCLQSIK
jgi:tetratricopeptide (TPR) repeat protein